MTLATIHGAGAAVATAILSCDLSIDVADKDDCHDDEDDIYDNFLHSCLNPESVIRPLRGSVVKQIWIIKQPHKIILYNDVSSFRRKRLVFSDNNFQ